MKRITWREGMELPADPDADEVYQWDWSDWLDGDTIVNPPVILADAGISAALEFLGPDYVNVRVSGGTVGKTYGVTVRVTSAPTDRTDDRTVRFAVRQR